MPSKSVATVEPSTVPALVNTPSSSQITAEDIAIPTVYLGQTAQTQVSSGNAGPGDIYTAQNQDDSEANVLWDYVEPAVEPGVLIVPLHLRKSWSYSPGVGQQLEMWPFEARGRAYPDGPPLDDPDPRKRAWLTYNYVGFLPEVDAEMPFKLRFYRSSAPAAQKINGILARDPEHFHGWRMVTVKRTRQGMQPWYIPQLATVDLTDDQQAAAVRLFNMLKPGFETQAVTTDAPPAV